MVPALDELWIVGDLFLSFAAEHLKHLHLDRKAQRLKQFFMYHNFDVRFGHTPIAQEKNILTRLRSAISDLINHNKKLPRILLVIIDKDFTKLGASGEVYDKVLKWVMVEICGMIQQKKGKLLSKCYRESEPKVVFAKPVAKFELLDVDNINREMKRLFNRSIEKIVKKLRYFYAINIDDIIPNDASIFELLAGSLTLKGSEVFWNCVDHRIKEIGAGKVKQHRDPTRAIHSGESCNAKIAKARKPSAALGAPPRNLQVIGSITKKSHHSWKKPDRFSDHYIQGQQQPQHFFQNTQTIPHPHRDHIQIHHQPQHLAHVHASQTQEQFYNHYQ